MLRGIRDTANPFELSERTFVRYFRLDRESARVLIDDLEPFADTKRIPFHLCVLGALMLLGKGSYQKNIGISALYGVSQSTVSRYFHQVIDLINRHVVPNEIQFPVNDEDVRRNVDGFRARYNEVMPEIVGIIDGTLVAITSPPIFSNVFPARLYRTRKGYTGLNVLVITGYDGRFLYINARYPGSCHDSAVFRTSLVRLQLLTEFQRTGRNRGILLGDQGFGVEPFLFPPIPGRDLSRDQQAYNRAHKVVRMSVENTIGDLKIVFRCLLKHRTLHYDPTFAGKIVYASGALHNFRIRRRIRAHYEYDGGDGSESDESEVDRISDMEDEIDENENDERHGGINLVRGGRNLHPGDLYTAAGNQKRNEYIRNHFFNR